jgi:hypothetical protein
MESSVDNTFRALYKDTNHNNSKLTNQAHRYNIFGYLFLPTVLKIFAHTSCKNYLVCSITLICI